VALNTKNKIKSITLNSDLLNALNEGSLIWTLIC
jgi:hypothetical protein